MIKTGILARFAFLFVAVQAVGMESAHESAREIPVACNVDIVVVGGSTGAVAAAQAATEHGARVFLAAPRPYLGEDICATLRLRLADGQVIRDPLAERLFKGNRSTTPIVVKKVLDEVLLAAGVQYLYGCYATDVLRDADNKPSGIVMANRAGRQAVIAKIIIDATDRGWVARMAGATSRSWPDDGVLFERTVIMPGQSDKGEPVFRRLKLQVPDGRFGSLAAAEQTARDETYVEGQLRAAEAMFCVPPDPIVCRGKRSDWKGPESVDLAYFRPKGVDRFYVLSAAGDVPRQAAAELLQPAAMIPISRTIGATAADEARAMAKPREVRLRGDGAELQAGDVREVLKGLRPTDIPSETVPADSRSVPVLGRYDVVVVGGGTAGAPAAIGASRRGAKTLVIEYQEALGGTGTMGEITRPYHGQYVGFTKEVPFPDGQHNVEYKMEWYRREIRKAGGEIWFGVLGCGAWVEGYRVRGVAVATPEGRGIVLADCVVDATGNADVATAAGADTVYGAGEADIAMQGAGLPVRPLKPRPVNTDYLLVDESDMLDVWRALVGTRLAMGADVYDAGTLIQTRERRRIVGDHVLRYLDQVAERTYPDSIVLSASDYDAHGYTVDPYFALFPHDEESIKANHPAPGGECYTPYRCLLPRGLDGILVAGIGISMERDAAALVRMQRDVQNQGYAAGVAAAMISDRGCGTRELDVKALQKHLVEIGNLPEEVLRHRDSFPRADEEIRRAVAALAETDQRQRAAKALAVVLRQRRTAMPMLEDAYSESGGEKKLAYAKVMGMLGDRKAVPTLVEALDAIPAWDAKILQGRMAEYAHLPTPVDALVMALGHTQDPRALPAILRKLEMLDADVTLSHHRAVALALERIGDPSAAKPLADLLAKPEMSGHALTEIEPLPSGMNDRRDRTAPLREIVLARALYRCGDFDDVGKKILQNYERDLRGLFARHAAAVLKHPTGGQDR